MSGNYNYQPKQSSVFVISLWLSCVMLLPVFLFFTENPLLLFLSFIAFYFIFFSVFYLRKIHCLVTIKNRELYVQQGAIFKFTFRFPLRFITSISLFSSPLLKLLGLCVLVISTNGSGVILFGFSIKDGLDIEKHLLSKEV